MAMQRQLSLSNISDNERLDLVTMFAPFALFTCSQVSVSDEVGL